MYREILVILGSLFVPIPSMLYSDCNMSGHHKRRTSHGFTIVELLIVIIVIAILAAIVIVAYNGMQQKANNAQTVESVAAYARVAHAYAAQNGTYPINTGYPCLGPSGTKCANVTSSASTCYGSGGASYMASFDSAIRTIASSIPGPSAQLISCGGDNYAGAFYHSAADGKTASIIYYVAGSSGCGSPGGVSIGASTVQGAGTQCRGDLPAL